MNDHRIRIGDIQPSLYDRRRDKHVNITVDKVKHDLFQLMLLHLSVCKCDLRLRNERCDPVRDLDDRIDPVVDVVDLSAPRQLPADRLAHHLLIVLHDVGLDRHALLRRFLEHAHITDSDQAHMKRPRNRCRCQGEHVDVRLELLDLFFVCDTEPLLLIDNQKAEVFILDIL